MVLVRSSLASISLFILLLQSYLSLYVFVHITSLCLFQRFDRECQFVTRKTEEYLAYRNCFWIGFYPIKNLGDMVTPVDNQSKYSECLSNDSVCVCMYVPAMDFHEEFGSTALRACCPDPQAETVLRLAVVADLWLSSPWKCPSLDWLRVDVDGRWCPACYCRQCFLVVVQRSRSATASWWRRICLDVDRGRTTTADSRPTSPPFFTHNVMYYADADSFYQTPGIPSDYYYTNSRNVSLISHAHVYRFFILLVCWIFSYTWDIFERTPNVKVSI